MTHFTKFAGLTAPDQGDNLSVDGNSFFLKNPDLTDFFLKIGALTHHHDGHNAQPDPTVPPSANALSTGGTIPSLYTTFLAYTVSDIYGGETLASAPVAVSTQASLDPPAQSITAVFDSSGGSLPVGDYSYAITFVDISGGETTIGPGTDVTRSPGFASGQVQLSGLNTEFATNGAVSWRLWRSTQGGAFQLIATGATPTFTDTGLNCADATAIPPIDNSLTRSTNSIQVILPSRTAETTFASATASAINLYESADGSFTNPCLYSTFPVASGGQVVTITDTLVDPGAPPEVSTTVAGANPINPDTDMLDWHWKRPVANAGTLPGSPPTTIGDVRVTLNDGHVHVYVGSSWVDSQAAATEIVADEHGNSAIGSATFYRAIASAQGDAYVDYQGSTPRVTYGIPSGSVGPQGPTGPTGPQGPAGTGGGGGGTAFEVSGSADLAPLINPTSDIEFAASGGLAVAVQSLGGGSARILYAPSATPAGGPQGPQGPAGPQGPQGTAGTSGGGGGGSIAVSGSAGVGPINPTSDIVFAASGGIGLAIQNQTGGSAEVLFGPATPQPRGQWASGAIYSPYDLTTFGPSAFITPNAIGSANQPPGSYQRALWDRFITDTLNNYTILTGAGTQYNGQWSAGVEPNHVVFSAGNGVKAASDTTNQVNAIVDSNPAHNLLNDGTVIAKIKDNISGTSNVNVGVGFYIDNDNYMIFKPTSSDVANTVIGYTGRVNGNAQTATVLSGNLAIGNTTPWWLKITKVGVNITVSLYTSDPDQNAAFASSTFTVPIYPGLQGATWMRPLWLVSGVNNPAQYLNEARVDVPLWRTVYGTTPPSVAGSAGVGLIQPDFYTEYAASAGAGVNVTNMGGGSAKVVLGTPVLAGGVATLAAGTVVVQERSVTANSRILLTAQDNNTTGALRVSARTAGTSFTITSSNAGDTGVVAYQFIGS